MGKIIIKGKHVIETGCDDIEDQRNNAKFEDACHGGGSTGKAPLIPKSEALRLIIENGSMNVINNALTNYDKENHLIKTGLNEKLGKPTDNYSFIRDYLPRALFAEGKFSVTPLKNQSDYQLIELLFQKVCISDHGQKIKNHYMRNLSVDLEHNMNRWISASTPIFNRQTGLPQLIEAIKTAVKDNYRDREDFPCVDVSSCIEQNWLSFRESYFDLDELIPFGGVEQIEIEGELLAYNIIKRDYELKVKLNFTFKDWFGVDEDDVVKMAISTGIDRDGLAAFWVLQHQRGHKPFINVVYYSEEISIRSSM
jgi:hypothetical protein